MISRTGVICVIALCLAACVLTAGCTQQSAQVETTTAPQATVKETSGMADPASVNCGKLGGTTEIKKDASGAEYGMCTFKNGTSCEEWALFRNEGCKSGVTPAETQMAGLANPASVNCGKLGGTTEIKKDAAGGEYGMCTFKNGTSCEEWALFRNEGCRAGVK